MWINVLPGTNNILVQYILNPDPKHRETQCKTLYFVLLTLLILEYSSARLLQNLSTSFMRKENTDYSDNLETTSIGRQASKYEA